MMIEVPGVGVVEFPDNAEPEVVANAMRGFMQERQRAQAGTEVAAETGPLDAAAIAAGKAFTDVGRGAEDLYYRATGNDSAREQLAQRQAEEAQLYAPLQEARPIATALGEAAPYVGAGGVVGAGVRGAGLAANLAAQGAGGAAIGGTSYAPTMEERAANAAVEGALSTGGEALGRVLTRLMRPGMNPAGGSTMEAAESAKRLGYRVRPASRIESDSTKDVIEGGFESMPGSAHVFDELAAQNQALYNRHVSQAIGENTEELTGKVLDDAKTRMGGVFDSVLSRNLDVPLDDDFVETVVELDHNRIRPMLLPPEDPLQRLFTNTYEMLEGGAITGRELHAQQSRLGSAARAELRKTVSDPNRAFALFDLQHALLDLAQRHIPAEAADLLRTTRQQYRHFANLIGSKAVDPVAGDVNAGKLGRSLEARDKRGFLFGRDRSPYYEGTRFLQRVQPPLKSSGTAERSYMGDVLKTAGLGVAGGLGTGYVSGEDMLQHAGLGAGATLGSMIVAPNLMARGYLRPAMQQWITSNPGALLDQSLRAGGMAGPRGLLGD